MAKTKPIGVRFDKDMLEVMKEDNIADTPQAALNFLSSFWSEKRDKPGFSESKIFEKSDAEIKEAIAKNEKKNDLSEKKKYLSEKKLRLDDIRAMCPAELTGLDRSAWISQKRQELGI